jgi:hypothetical protein
MTARSAGTSAVGDTAPVRLVPAMRAWLLLDAFLVFVTGIQCFVLAERTADFFAWTINPPLTAAFLGGCYWAALPLVALSAREKTWARARVAVYGVLVFTAVTTLATLLHLDRFHFDADDPMPRMAAWAWMAVYAVVPPGLLVLLLFQERQAGMAAPRLRLLPGWYRSALVGQAAIMLGAGAIVFVAPEADWWPWQLSPLTGRAIAAWPLGIGLTMAHAAFENDWDRIRPGVYSYAVLGALQLVNLVRFSDSVQWEEPGATLYAAFAATVVAVGLYGVLAVHRRADR